MKCKVHKVAELEEAFSGVGKGYLVNPCEVLSSLWQSCALSWMQGAQAAELEEAFGGGGIKGFLLEGVLGALQVAYHLGSGHECGPDAEINTKPHGALPLAAAREASCFFAGTIALSVSWLCESVPEQNTFPVWTAQTVSSQQAAPY